MSTRSQIAFYESKEATIESAKVFIYRHSDGMPESVLPELLPVVKWFDKVRGLDHTAYATARCIQHLANQYDVVVKASHERLKIKDMDDSFALGYGIETEIVGDIEYFYHVSPGLIQVFTPNYDKKTFEINGWKLLKSVAFKTKKETVS